MVSKDQSGKIIEETRLLVNLFLETNASDKDLAKMTGISSSTVGRRLISRENIIKAFPLSGEEKYEIIKAKRQENLLKGKALGGQTTLLNHVYTRDNRGRFNGVKLSLDAIYSKHANQDRFLVHAALTFRLHLDTLSSLFQIDEEELFKRMTESSNAIKESVLYLFNDDVEDQEIAKEKFICYYKELVNAIRRKDLDTKRILISQISDCDVLEFKDQDIGTNITDDIFASLISYQFKYALTIEQLESVFKFDIETFQEHLKNYMLSNPHFKKDYEYLITVKGSTRNIQ